MERRVRNRCIIMPSYY